MQSEIETIPKPAPIPVERLAELIIGRVPAPDLTKTELLLATTRAIRVIESNDDSSVALRYASEMNGQIKAITEHFKPYNDAANELRSGMAQLRDGHLKPLLDEIARIKGADGIVMAWDRQEARRVEQERRAAAEEAQRQADEEKRRIAAEARAKADEIDRVAREAEQEAIGRAEAMAIAGRLVESEALVEQAAQDAAASAHEAQAVVAQATLDAADVRPAPIIMPPSEAPGAGIKGGGASKSKTWTWEIDAEDERRAIYLMARAACENPDAFLCYLALNEKALNAAAKAQGEYFQAPGIRAIEKEGIRLGSMRK